jgi:hypothetical protein
MIRPGARRFLVLFPGSVDDRGDAEAGRGGRSDRGRGPGSDALASDDAPDPSRLPTEEAMRVERYEFGEITIDGVRYEHDVVIAGGRIRKRKKGPSKGRKAEFGHTPLTAAEEIPWDARQLWIGTGAHGGLPVAEDVREEARRRGVKMVIRETPALVKMINERLPTNVNLILHVTC